MNTLTINPKTGGYGTGANIESGQYFHITNAYVPQFNINNEYVGMMVFGKFISKDWYRSHWK